MADAKYMLEIYMPGSTQNVWESFESDTPFMAINQGDIINPTIWDGSQSPMKVLIATRIEHLIWQVPYTNTARHKILVFTREVENAVNLRIEEASDEGDTPTPPNLRFLPS